MTLRFRLLGEPQIWYGDVRLDKLLSRKQLALLIFLVCHDRPFRRERLATLLWGDCEQTNALYNLRRALYVIGKTMETVGIDRLLFLEVDHDEMRFLSDAPYSSDVQELRGAVARADFQRAAELHGQFLGSFTINDAREFEEWQRMQCAIFDVVIEQTAEANMSKREDVILVKLALGALATEQGETVAASLYTRTLDEVAETPCREFDVRKVQAMKARLASIQGIGKQSAIQLLAQLGWFVSQTIDSGIAPVVY